MEEQHDSKVSSQVLQASDDKKIEDVNSSSSRHSDKTTQGDSRINSSGSSGDDEHDSAESGDSGESGEPETTGWYG